MSAVKVLVGGQIFENFENMRIFSDMYSLADTFSFGGVGRGNGKPAVKPGQTCKISIDGKIVMSGKINSVRKPKSSNGTRFDFSGTDICGWVAGLTAAEMKEYYGKTTPAVIVNELKTQIPELGKIAVAGLDKLPPIAEFTVNTGETVSNIFNQMADRTNTIWFARPDGVIVFAGKNKGQIRHRVTLGKDFAESITVTESIDGVCDKLVYFCEGGDGGVTKAELDVPIVPRTGKIKHQRIQARMEEIKDYVKRGVNEIVEKYIKIDCTIAGFADSQNNVYGINDGVWITGTNDTNIDGRVFVIESVEFNYSRDKGQTVSIKMSLPAVF